MKFNHTETIWDSVIYGGGLRAVSAAARLLENNRKVLLALPGGFAGSEITSSLHPCLVPGISQTADRLLAELRSATAADEHFCDSAAAFLRILKMLRTADILFYVRPAAVIAEDGLLKGIVLASKKGIFAVRAKTFIDASDSLAVTRRAEPEKICEAAANADSVFSFRLESETPFRFQKAALPGMNIRRTIRPGEVQTDVRGAVRTDLPAILARVRKEIPEFRSAILSNASFSVLNLTCASLNGPLSAKNLFAAQTPESFEFEDYARLSSVRMREGELLADAANPVIPQVRPGTVRPGEVCVRLDPDAAKDAPCGVLVCGGGTAGALAAIAAARQKVSTTIWESLDYLGGVGTGGMIPCYYYGTPGGLQDEIDEKTNLLTHEFLGKHAAHGFHPVAKMIVLEQTAREAGVRIEFNRMICGVETKNAKDSGVLLPAFPGGTDFRELEAVHGCSETGNFRSDAKTFIDATGDGDVAAAAGARQTAGRESDGLQHIYSLPGLYLDCVETEGRKDECHFVLMPCNIDAGYCDALDPWDVSRARREALASFDSKSFPDGPNRIRVFSAVVGTRASRQIRGEYRLSLADQIRGAEFPDTIGYASAHYDNHAQDYENESPQAMLWSWALDSYNEFIGSEIPYRILLPQGVGNLLVACHALSLDYDAHLQFRMQRDMQRMGEAAGIAAALAVQAGSDPRNISIPRLQKELAQTKALCGTGPSVHSGAWKPANFYPDKRVFELADTEFCPAGKLLADGQETQMDQLKNNLKDSKPEIRYGAALKLASAGGNPEALQLLPACIRERCDAYPVKSWKFRSAPFWKIAVGVCGARGYTPAREAVEEILCSETPPDFQGSVLALRALGRIGNDHSIPVIEKFLKRTDLSFRREFPHWITGKEIFDDARWTLELAAYETLRQLGKKDPALLNPWLADSRKYVRNAAERVRDRTAD